MQFINFTISFIIRLVMSNSQVFTNKSTQDNKTAEFYCVKKFHEKGIFNTSYTL